MCWWQICVWWWVVLTYPDPDQNLVWFSDPKLELGPGSIFEEPETELDFWSHLWVRLEPEVFHKSKESPNIAKYEIPLYSMWSCLYSPLGFTNNQKFYTCISCQTASTSRLMCWMLGWPAFEFPGQGTHGAEYNVRAQVSIAFRWYGAWHRECVKCGPSRFPNHMLNVQPETFVRPWHVKFIYS
jgi:hypothetical protein